MIVALLLIATIAGHDALAEVRQDGKDTADKEHRAEAPARPSDMPLADLPEPPSLRLGPPRPAALEAIDQLLQRLVGDDPVVRERAARSILEAKPDWVSGIARRIDQLAERSDKTAQKALLQTLRDKTRKQLASLDPDLDQTPDYLEVALAHAAPQDADWKGLTQLLALRRMLETIGTTEAVREIIRIYVRFGEYMRIDCQRGLEALEDRALAGLIEARRHPAPKIAEWAERRLRLRNKNTAHEAVRTQDTQALADILVALGRERDPETTRLLVSFAGTEQSTVQTAARQAIALQGEVAAWQLRDAYLDTTGKQPPRDWTWKRTARELFTEFDRLRMEKVYRLFQEGQKAEHAQDLAKMVEHYDQVLSLSPEFVRRTDMARGYFEYAKKTQESSPENAALALSRVTRIAGDEQLRNAAQAALLLLEAERLHKLGIVDRALVERAAALDPQSRERAQSLLGSSTTATPAWGTAQRYAVGFTIALVSLLGAAWILFSGFWRQRKGRAQPDQR